MKKERGSARSGMSLPHLCIGRIPISARKWQPEHSFSHGSIYSPVEALVGVALRFLYHGATRTPGQATPSGSPKYNQTDYTLRKEGGCPLPCQEDDEAILSLS